MTELDPQLKALIEANSSALAALLTKLDAGETAVTEEIAKVRATDADLLSAITGPQAESAEPSAPSD